MKRPALIGLLTACAAVITACSIPAQDAAPATQAPATQPAATQPAVSANPATSSTAPASSFGGWSTPKLGTMEPKIKREKLFRPCRDIPDHVAEKLGIVLERERGEKFMPYGCPIKLKDKATTAAYSIHSWMMPIKDMVANNIITIESEISGFPGAVTTRTNGQFRKQTCESMVDTERGVIGISYASFELQPSGQTFCERPESLLKELFQVVK